VGGTKLAYFKILPTPLFFDNRNSTEGPVKFYLKLNLTAEATIERERESPFLWSVTKYGIKLNENHLNYTEIIKRNSIKYEIVIKG